MHFRGLIVEKLHKQQGPDTGEGVNNAGAYQEEHTGLDGNPFLLQCLSSTFY